jgi:hypothetical protein
MALVIADRVRETTTTTGTGAVTLAGAYTSFQTFLAGVGNANSTYYTIASAATGEWEVGIGTYTSASNTLSRTTVLASSNSGSLVNFSAGAKDVFVTQPAERSLLVQSAGSGLFSGVAAFTSGGVPYADSTSTLTTGSALTFDGSSLGVGTSSYLNAYTRLQLTRVGYVQQVFQNTLNSVNAEVAAYDSYVSYGSLTNHPIAFQINNSEAMRLTSTGLGIGTSSPAAKLDVAGTFNGTQAVFGNTSGRGLLIGTALNGGVNEGSSVLNARGAGNGQLLFQTDGTTRMTLNDSGNLGLGVTPSAWTNSFGVIQGLGGWSISHNGANSNSVDFLSNAYRSGGANTYLYIASANATRYQQLAGVHAWYTAASGTAGNAITFTQAMTLDADGRLKLSAQSTAPNDATGFWLSNVAGVGPVLSGLNVTFQTGATGAQSERARITSDGYLAVGTTSVDEILRLNGSSNATARIRLQNQGTTLGWFGSYYGITALGNGNDLFVANATSNSLIFGTDSTERARITSAGYFGINTSAPNALLQVNCGGSGTTTISTVTDFGAGNIVSVGKVQTNDSGVYLGTGDALTSTSGGIAAGFGLFREASGWNSAIAFYTNGTTDGTTTNRITERARIDSSGSFLVGTSANNWGVYGGFSEFKKDQNSRTLLTVSNQNSGSSGAAGILLASYGNSWIQAIGTTANNSNALTWSLDATSPSEKMCLTTSGNLGIGTSSPSGIFNIKTSNGQFLVQNGTSSAQMRISAFNNAGNANAALIFEGYTSEYGRFDASGRLLVGLTSGTSGYNIEAQAGASGTGIRASNSGGGYIAIEAESNATSNGVLRWTNDLKFIEGSTERMRLSSGNLMAGRTSALAGARISAETSTGSPTFASYGPTTGTEYAFDFVNPNGIVGSITTNGSATAFNTSSDYRLKDNPQPLNGSGAFIDALKPKTWKWKVDGSVGVGFIAHEVQEVSPNSVVGEKDGEQMQAMEYGSAEFIANIIAELQSLRARVAQLEAKGA